MMGLGGFFGSKKKQEAETNEVREQVKSSLSDSQRILEARFAHLESLVRATLVELHRGRLPPNHTLEDKR